MWVLARSTSRTEVVVACTCASAVMVCSACGVRDDHCCGDPERDRRSFRFGGLRFGVSCLVFGDGCGIGELRRLWAQPMQGKLTPPESLVISRFPEQPVRGVQATSVLLLKPAKNFLSYYIL